MIKKLMVLFFVLCAAASVPIFGAEDCLIEHVSSFKSSVYDVFEKYGFEQRKERETAKHYAEREFSKRNLQERKDIWERVIEWQSSFLNRLSEQSITEKPFVEKDYVSSINLALFETVDRNLAAIMRKIWRQTMVNASVVRDGLLEELLALVLIDQENL